eukprot:1698914-Alexandrium_andersonii.AAC.1
MDPGEGAKPTFTFDMINVTSLRPHLAGLLGTLAKGGGGRLLWTSSSSRTPCRPGRRQVHAQGSCC